ncbi:response regulator [Halomonadaceae bacterium KBTZ08]
MKSQSCAIDILLVEDNPADVDLTIESFAEAGNRACLYPVSDGEEAMRFLRHEGEHSGSVRPDLVLLDLNLPRMDGREVLQAIKTDPDLRSLPVIVLTSSQAQKDITTSYELHANCYITKPLGLSQFYQLAEAIEVFWSDVATLPA